MLVLKERRRFLESSDALPQFKQKKIEIVPASHLLDSEIDLDFEYFWEPETENRSRSSH